MKLEGHFSLFTRFNSAEISTVVTFFPPGHRNPNFTILELKKEIEDEFQFKRKFIIIVQREELNRNRAAKP